MEIGEGERHAHLKTAHLTLLSPSDNGKITLFASQAHVAKNHVARAGLDELAVHKKNSMMTKSWLLDGQIKEVKAKLKGFEIPRALHIEVEPFAVENGLLTPTFKLKRPVAKKHYRAIIDSLYAQLSGSAPPARL